MGGDCDGKPREDKWSIVHRALADYKTSVKPKRAQSAAESVGQRMQVAIKIRDGG